jgi:hypothetical protein
MQKRLVWAHLTLVQVSEAFASFLENDL